MHERGPRAIQDGGAERDDRDDAAVHGLRIGQPEDRLDRDDDRHSEKQPAVRQRGEDRGAVMTERASGCRSPNRVAQREDAMPSAATSAKL